MRPRDPWRLKLDAQIERRRQRGDGFGRDVLSFGAARQELREGHSCGEVSAQEASAEVDETPPLSPASPLVAQLPEKPRRRFPLDLAFACVVAFLVPVSVHYFGVLDLNGPSLSSATAASVPTPTAAPRLVARAIPICSGPMRVTCIVDGDTGWQDGVKWRLVTRDGGVDAPEISKPECAAERTAGDQATRRLQDLMSGGYTMTGGDYDRYDRRLVRIALADGRDAGDTLIAERLAQEWPNSGNPWCGG